MPEVNGGFFAVDDVGQISNPRGDSVLGLQRFTQNGRVAGHLYTYRSGVWTDITGPANTLFVDGTNGSDNNNGTVLARAFATIQAAITAALAGYTIYIKAKAMAAGATDPVDYAETLTIPAGKSRLRLVGLSEGPAQGNVPQIKKGSGATALLTVRSPGCYVGGLGFNGAGATGGGILLDDDGSTKTAFGTVIEACHFKNCKGSTATSAATGGAIQLGGAPWQVTIRGNRFYKNVGGIVLLNTTNSVPQDIEIEDNRFVGSAGAVDCDIYLAGGSGPGAGLSIVRNVFGPFPALGSGAVLRWMDLTGADEGIVAGNYFAEDKTFGATGTGAKVPTTVLLSGNYDEGGLIARV